MKKLYAPWRTKYAKDVVGSKEESIKKEECVFCIQFNENQDEKHFVLVRTAHCIVMLNRYPYNAGHLLILPIAHAASLEDLMPPVRAEIMEWTSRSCEIVKRELGAQGINVGINLGKIAGAGIPSHLHIHVLPRWLGDTNFMPLLGHTKQVSFDLEEIYFKLKKVFT